MMISSPGSVARCAARAAGERPGLARRRDRSGVDPRGGVDRALPLRKLFLQRGTEQPHCGFSDGGVDAAEVQIEPIDRNPFVHLATLSAATNGA
jgi:hypothetical protein